MWHYIVHALQPANVFHGIPETAKLDKFLCTRGGATKRNATLPWYFYITKYYTS